MDDLKRSVFSESEVVMMKKSLRLSLLMTVIAAALLLFAFTALAVPAAPGTHTDGSCACKSHVGQLLTLSDVAATAARRNGGPMRAPSLDPVTSDVPLAVIVIGFRDQAYRADFDWAQEIFRADMSLAEYYTDMSFGQFTFTPVQETSAYHVGGNQNTKDAANDGVIHVTLSTDHDDWTLEYAYLSKKDIAANRTLAQALIAAVEAADAYIDFAAYDVNGDGDITTDELAIGFVVAGYEASSALEYTYDKSSYLWSHAYSFRACKEDYDFDYAIPAPDGVTVDSYIAISEQENDGSQEPISTLAHELGHYIGLPDLYDTEYNNALEWGKYDVRYLSVMAGGMYGTDPATGKATPYSLDAWSRSVLGWVEPDVADGSGDHTLTVQNYTNNTGYKLLRIPTQNPGEYYLLENRGFSKWDAGLAAEYGRDAGGLVLWHIDDNIFDEYEPTNEVNNTGHRPAVMPLYAETASNGSLTFIGKTRTVDLNAAFFDKAGWNGTYAATLGAALDLPVYGTGSNANLRSGRTNSGILLTFLSNSGASMKVRVSPDGHVHNPVLKQVTAPTCTAAGTGYYECSLCGKRFTDATGATETTGTVALPALGHTEPNAQGQCARCGAQLVAEEDLCPYCHTYHSGPLGGFVAFIHRILYFFAHLFGRM